MEYDVRLVHEPSRELAVTTFEAADAGAVAGLIGKAFATVAEFLVQRGAPPAGPAVAYYESAPDGSFLVAAGFTVPRELQYSGDVMPFRLPGGEVATTTHVGSYADLPRAYDALRRAAGEHGRTLEESGGMWEEYWSGSDVPQDEARTDVFWPLKPR